MADAVIRVGADTSQAERALGSLQNNLAKLGLAAAVTGVGVAINKALSSVDALAKRSRALGTTAAALQALERSAALAGVSSEQLSATMSRVQRSIGEAFVNSTSQANKSLQALNLSANELSTLPTDQAIQKIIEQLKQVENPAERARLSIELLGRQGPSMLEIADNVDFFTKRAQELGIALTQVDTRNIENANDAMSRVAFVLEQGIQKAVAQLAPLIEALAVKVEQAAGIMIRVFSEIGNQSDRILSILGTLAVFLAGKLLVAATLAAGGFMAMVKAKLAAAAAAGVLRAALIKTGIGILIIAVGELVFRFLELSKVLGGVGNTFVLMGQVARDVFDRIKTRLRILGEQFNIVGEVIKKAFVNAFAAVVDRFVAMTQVLADGFNSLFGVFGITIEAAGGDLARRLRELGNESEASILASQQSIASLAQSLQQPIESWEQLKTAIRTSLTSSNQYKDATDDLTNSLDLATTATNGLSISTQELNRLREESEKKLLSIRGLDARYTAHQTNVDRLKDLEQAYSLGLVESDAELARLRLLINEQYLLDRYSAEETYQNRIRQLRNQALQEEFKQAGFADQVAKELAEKRVKYEQMSAEQRRDASLGYLSQSLNDLGTFSKEAFAAAKALNIATAIMNTYKAATQAMAAYPPPFSFIAAGAAITAGMAQVANIRSQSYSGRALGGPVMAGQPYLVGERGAEMFIPNTTGRISNSRETSESGAPVNINFNIQTNDATGFDQLLLQRRPMIINMVRSAMNDRGNRSLV
jgi:hypothetical protein